MAELSTQAGPVQSPRIVLDPLILRSRRALRVVAGFADLLESIKGLFLEDEKLGGFLRENYVISKIQGLLDTQKDPNTVLLTLAQDLIEIEKVDPKQSDRKS